MTTLVVPAFASSSGGELSGRDLPGVPIDYMELLNGSYAGSVADWPNNYGKWGDSVDCTYPFAGFICSRLRQDSLKGNFSTQVYPHASCSKVRLFSSNIYLMPACSFKLHDDGYQNVVFTDVTITGNYVLPYPSNGSYALSHTSFSKSFSFNTREIDLVSCIKSAAQTGDILPNDILWIQDLSITFSFYFDQPDAPYFTVDVGNCWFANLQERWFSSYKFTPSNSPDEETVQFNLFDWLLDSVNAFLDFEIAPNFSLNKLFFITLVVGVLLWFIRLMGK
jgi:hypothetical protein